MRQPLFFQWGVSTKFGWGVYGLNLIHQWPKIAGAPAYNGGDIQLESFGGMDPLRLRSLAPLLVEADRLRAQRATGDKHLPFDGIVIHSVGNRFSGSAADANPVTGKATFAATFFEDTILPDAVANCGRFALVIAGSTWNEQVLRGNGVDNVTTALQGVDPSLFHPAQRWGALNGRYAVFSGGKLEHRKAQDLVLLAFRAFAQRHPEAVLVTAWNSPWTQTATTINHNPRIAPVTVGSEGKIDFAAWAAVNGIREDQFIDIGSLPNHVMPQVLREMDVAVFPNRCEGGTNLVAMECLACGVPTIVSNNTGHKDLVATGAPYPLTRQGPVSVNGIGTEGWGECDVDEIVEALERTWTKREEASQRGAAGSAAMAQWTWGRQIARLYSILIPMCA